MQTLRSRFLTRILGRPTKKKKAKRGKKKTLRGCLNPLPEGNLRRLKNDAKG